MGLITTCRQYSDALDVREESVRSEAASDAVRAERKQLLSIVTAYRLQTEAWIRELDLTVKPNNRLRFELVQEVQEAGKLGSELTKKVVQT